MKSLSAKLFVVMFLSFGLTFTACKSSPKDTETKEINKDGKEYTSAYVCPMHCPGSGSDVAGSCNICGMEYIENKDVEKTGHEGHNH